MPIFEYRCSGCGHRFEQIVAHDKSGPCPKCNGRKLEKQLSVFAVAGASRSAASSGGADSSASAGGDGGCGTCGDPRGPGSCETGGDWDD